MGIKLKPVTDDTYQWRATTLGPIEITFYISNGPKVMARHRWPSSVTCTNLRPFWDRPATDDSSVTGYILNLYRALTKARHRWLFFHFSYEMFIFVSWLKPDWDSSSHQWLLACDGRHAWLRWGLPPDWDKGIRSSVTFMFSASTVSHHFFLREWLLGFCPTMYFF